MSARTHATVNPARALVLVLVAAVGIVAQIHGIATEDTFEFMLGSLVVVGATVALYLR